MLWYQSVPVWFQQLFPKLIWRIPEKDKIIYLTFDDGPHPEISLWVMQELEKYRMKATFFCVGDNARKHPETLKKLLDSGHKIGNHTMRHIKGWNTGITAYVEDVKDCSQYIDSHLFRPPYGRITPSQIVELEKKYTIVMWSLLSCDYIKKLNINNALSGLKSKTKKGSIVVFHDSVKAEKNLKVLLPHYLKFLNEMGYLCKTL